MSLARVSYTFGAKTVVLTEALTEAGTDGVEGLGKHIEWYTSFYSSMPDTRAIEVHFDTAFARVFRNTNYFVLREYRPIKCILQLYHFGRTTAAKPMSNEKEFKRVRTNERHRLARWNFECLQGSGGVLYTAVSCGQSRWQRIGNLPLDGITGMT